ncbi:PREDICTED: uncharacterized protein LOC108364609 isoform X2 [Rhagoletis zephyria]|nr:PREDICTED: uncharacterized protein LOC108364609 isoform X2 [Rhagoletis zephyria]
MLKRVSPAANIGYNFSKSKCAEIHYHSSTFSILCTFCGMRTLAFSEFCNHFHNHYETFINAWVDKEESIINSDSEIIENFDGKRDPLKLEVRDGTKGSEEDLNILQFENKEASKEGGVNEVSNYDETVSIHGFDRHQTEPASDAPDTELFRTTIKLESTDVSCKGSTNMVNTSTKVSPNDKCTSEEDENSTNDLNAQ